jgi:hypothetical protein
VSFIQANLDKYTVKQMCKVLKFPRSTYYATINHVTSQREIDYNKFSDEVQFYYDQSKERIRIRRIMVRFLTIRKTYSIVILMLQQ